jgi:cyclophilin family peptidyl-prolyl cis-trans isomerase/HEAT repeat protein
MRSRDANAGIFCRAQGDYPVTVLLALVLLLADAILAQQPTLAERMLRAEDSRAQTDAELAPLREGLNSRHPNTRRQAVRAIGRLERAELIPLVTRLLADPNVEVRIEAANAVGQLGRGPTGVAAAKTRLVARTRIEKEPRVWGPVAATLGRLSYTTAADVQQVESILAAVLPTPATTALSIDALLGAVEGLEALARQSGKVSPLKETTLNGLRAASELEGRAQDAAKLTRIRRLATLALAAAGAGTRPQLEAGIADPDEEVRRLTMIAARAPIEGREAVIAKGLADANPRVRYEALQTWGRQLQKTSCQPVRAAIGDANPHVSLLAIDLLGNGCPADESPAGSLQPLAAGLTSQPGAWHAPAHALVALAKTAPAEARTVLPRHVAHPIWQVRMYAAHAAGALAAFDELEQLGRDPHDNVREAALGELIALKRPEAALLALDAIGRPDYQLVMTAARALANPAVRDRAIPALVQALARITVEKRETSRDARMAILDRLKELGWPDGSPLSAGPTLGPYLQDFDSAIASRTAEILQAWRKGPAQAAARPLPRAPATRAAVDVLRNARLRFMMAGRGVFELRLLIDEAPLSALRVATRAREGYYNGLTFHRVVPNFVIQGGSPGANEYMGDGPFMRDEAGLVSHRRGTVGISTRGRDTGDAQIFINLVDLPRLDHIYTVFAEVVAGMDVVDAVLEGDVIERVEVVPPT